MGRSFFLLMFKFCCRPPLSSLAGAGDANMLSPLVVVVLRMGIDNYLLFFLALPLVVDGAHRRRLTGSLFYHHYYC